jgi:hypothetical protein
VKKVSQTKAVPQMRAMHRPDEKTAGKSAQEIDARMWQHVRFLI